jgi:hypothetical protein
VSIAFFPDGFEGKEDVGHRWNDLTTAQKDWYVRYIVSRFAPTRSPVWNFTWEADIPDIMTQGFELMDRLISFDKFGHLRGVHEAEYDTNSFSDSRQTITLYENDISTVAFEDPVRGLPPSHHDAALACYAGKPLFCMEPTGLERRWLTSAMDPPVDDTEAEHRIRRNAWALVTAASSFMWEDHGTGSGATSAQVYGRLPNAIADLDILHGIMADEFAFWKMTPQDGVLSNFTGNAYCLAEIGAQYLVYRDSNGAFDITLPAVTYKKEWIDTRTNNRTPDGLVNGTGAAITMTPPATPTTEWVLKLVADDFVPVLQNLPAKNLRMAYMRM